MSKIKSEKSSNNSNEKIPIEKKSKKKLNKRQRKIKKKIENKKALELNTIVKPDELKKNPSKENQNKSLTLEQQRDLKYIKSSDQNSENYSSNWKQLQLIISNSKMASSQNPKRKNETQPTSLITNSKAFIAEKTNTNRRNNNKPVLTKPVMNANLIELDVETSRPIQYNVLKVENSFTGMTKVVAIDCEMVGGGLKGETDLLARVSIVNENGNVLYDKYVNPREEIVDYRTEFSGIRPENLVNAESFEVAQKEVSKFLSGNIVVGHGIKHDFQCLYLSHPRNLIRDTSKYKPFRKLVGGGRRTPSLRRLCDKILGIEIQHGEHDSIQDAQAAMRLYCLHKKEWEKEVPKIKKAFHKIKR